MSEEETKELVKREPTPIAATERGMQLQSLDDYWRFAGAVEKSGMAPRGMRQNTIMIAVQYGAEIGLKPMQSLQSVAIINNRPALYGDALPSLVYGSGKCKFIKEMINGEGDDMEAVCEAARSDCESTNMTRFSVKDAKNAKLWGKAGPWKDYPARMLQMRARSWCLRDLFADALRGVNVFEELQDTPQQPVPNQVAIIEDPILKDETVNA